MTTFPLFQLPLVAMEHVLCMMNPYEWINLSSSSTKSKRAVKKFSRTKPKFHLHLGLLREPYVSIDGKNERWTYRWALNESRIRYEYNDDHHIVYNYSKTPIKEWMKLYENIKEVLGGHLHFVNVDLSAFPSHNESIVDWLRFQQESVPAIDISNGYIAQRFDYDLEYFLNNITVINALILTTENDIDFFQMEIPTTPYEVLIEDSRFLHFEQLLRLKNREIFLVESRLTNREINAFLKSWMASESHLDLKAFYINVSGPEAMDVIMDLPHEETAYPNVAETFKKKFDNPQVDNWFDIKRSDGKVATVCSGLQYNQHWFFMLTR